MNTMITPSWILWSLLHEALLDELDLDNLLLHDDPLRNVVLMHQPEDLILLLQTPLHKYLDEDHIQQHRGYKDTEHDYDDIVGSWVEGSARIVSPLLHYGEHDVVNQLICIVHLDDVLKGEIGDVMEEGQYLLQEKIVVILSALHQLRWLDSLTTFYKVTFRNVFIEMFTPSCIGPITDSLDLVGDALIEDIAHAPTKIVVIEGSKVLLEGWGADGEFEIGIGGLDVTGFIDVGLVLAVVIQDTPSVLFNRATSDDVINAVSIHKGESQLLKSSEAIQTDSCIDVENEDNYSYASDSRKQNRCRLHDHLCDLIADLDLLDALVEIGSRCGETLLLISRFRATFLERAEVAWSWGVLWICLKTHPLVLFI